MIETHIPQKEIENLLYLYIKHVHFSSDGKIYMQFDGVAIGSALDPALANIFLIELEVSVIPSLGNY